MDRGSFISIVVAIVLLGLGGFAGWHMTPLSLALVTLGALTLWAYMVHKTMDDQDVSEGELVVGTILVILVVIMWFGAFVRSLVLLNGKTLYISLDLFVR